MDANIKRLADATRRTHQAGEKLLRTLERMEGGRAPGRQGAAAGKRGANWSFAVGCVNPVRYFERMRAENPGQFYAMAKLNGEFVQSLDPDKIKRLCSMTTKKPAKSGGKA